MLYNTKYSVEALESRQNWTLLIACSCTITYDDTKKTKKLTDK